MATPTSRASLAILNLSWTCTRQDLRSHFSKFGNVLKVFIPMDSKTGFNRQVGFVVMKGPQGFEEKIFQDYHTIDHQEVTVKPRDRKERNQTEKITSTESSV